jgi:hypothetical protein
VTIAFGFETHLSETFHTADITQRPKANRSSLGRYVNGKKAVVKENNRRKILKFIEFTKY